MFSTETFAFLQELSDNNNRTWFEANKSRYEALVREPAMDFIEAMEPALKSFAPEFRAEARKLGGSLMRVFRDTRFSRDKTPYKTNIGIQFRHRLGKDVHAPGFYLHIANDECFLGAGCWHPESSVLGKLRDGIAGKTDSWFAIRDEQRFAAHWQLAGESLRRPPRGYVADHPAIDDLMRKDFVAISPLDASEVCGGALVELAAQRYREAAPFMRFLCQALEVPY